LRIHTVAGQPTTNLQGVGTSREDRHAVETGFLALPDGAVTGVAYRMEREFLVVDPQFLEAHYVGSSLSKPIEQIRKTAAYAVYVER
jgi:hypothetical protein